MNVEHDLTAMKPAIEQARIGLEEGGVPVGAALAMDGKVLGVGRNHRVQRGSVIRHGESDCLENVGRLPASTYRQPTSHSTLSPCLMCTGTILLYGISRVVVGENRTFEASESLAPFAGRAARGARSRRVCRAYGSLRHPVAGDLERRHRRLGRSPCTQGKPMTHPYSTGAFRRPAR